MSNGGGRQKHESALEALRNAREGRGSRVAQYTVRDESITETVSDERYAELVDTRKRKGAFVVGDDTGEYDDDGEEDVVGDRAFYEADVAASDARPRKRSKMSSNPEKKHPTVAPRGRLTELFSKPKAAPKTAAPAVLSAERKAEPSSASPKDSDDALLAELLSDPQPVSSPPRPRASAPQPKPEPEPEPDLPEPLHSQPQPPQQKQQEPTAPRQTVAAPAAAQPAAAPAKAEAQAAAEPEKRRLSEGGLCDEDLLALDVDAIAEQARLEREEAAQPVESLRAAVPDAPPLDARGNLLFYWFDAADAVGTSPSASGSVYMFGKVRLADKRCVSCCVVVRNIPRVVYAVPRATALDEAGNDTGVAPTLEDVFHEIEDLRKQHGIQSIKAKPVSRNYAFECPGVPIGNTEMLKIVYSAKYPAFPADCSGRTFVRLFGTHTSALEKLILKRDLKGAEWLYLLKPTLANPPTTWCSYEIEVDDMKNILKPENPPASVPLTLMSVSTRTVMNHEKNENEVAVVSLVVESDVDVDAGTKGRTHARTFVRALARTLPVGFSRCQSATTTACSSEKALLGEVLRAINAIDPDVLLGHNILGYDLDVWLHRMRALGETRWSKLGRVRQSRMPRMSSDAALVAALQTAAQGRLVCDTYIMAKELIRTQKNYKLSELARTQLHVVKAEVEPEDVPRYYETAQGLRELVEVTEADARVVSALADRVKMLSLTKQLTNLAGNLWRSSLTGHRAERVEYLLLHEFTRQKFVVPDKHFSKEAFSKKKKAAYSGGLVLSPQVGFYDKIVVVLDFKSLYPSLIQEYNVCFTTVKRIARPEDGGWEAVEPEPDEAEGILPKVVRSLVDQRRRVKARMESEKDEGTKSALNIRQSALKLIANSLYGCLGFTFSRFYAKPLAELITKKGRETLQRSMEFVTNSGLHVIYGDTDSLMVNTGLDSVDDARKEARTVLTQINSHYKSMEIDIDNVFRRMLLLKKKKYAALEAVSGQRQMKGLDLVRRDWCDVSKEAGQFVIDQILSSAPRDDVATAIYQYLRDLSASVRAGRIELAKFAITKSLAKDPDAYDDGKQQHVQAAKRLKALGKKVRAGDFISYVVIKGDSSVLADRSYPIEAVQRDRTLQIDYEWYLEQQVHQPVFRLCRPIEEIQPTLMAECLGLDPAKFAVAATQGHGGADGDGDAFGGNLDLDNCDVHSIHEQLLSACESLLISCPNDKCAANPAFVFLGVSGIAVGTPLPQERLTCPNCKLPLNAAAVGNQCVLHLRSLVARHHAALMECQSPHCHRTTRQLVGKLRDHTLVCPVPGCKSEVTLFMTQSVVYYNMLHVLSLFDPHQSLFRRASSFDKPSVLLTQQQALFLRAVARRVEEFLEMSEYHFVDTSLLIAGPPAQAN
eukprot:m51a1_g8235 dna polymerase alpha catalytic subunit, putative (1391) ;mRNA; f:75258-80287